MPLQSTTTITSTLTNGRDGLVDASATQVITGVAGSQALRCTQQVALDFAELEASALLTGPAFIWIRNVVGEGAVVINIAETDVLVLGPGEQGVLPRPLATAYVRSAYPDGNTILMTAMDAPAIPTDYSFLADESGDGIADADGTIVWSP